MTLLETTRGGRIAWLAGMLILAVVGSAACSGQPRGAVDQGFVSDDGVIEQITPTDRVELAPIAGELLSGGSYDSRDERGNVVVYNIWGSWCTPCREEAPTLRRVWEANRDNGVQFVGINVRDNDAAAIAFERKFQITYPSIRTADSNKVLVAFGSGLPRSAVPSTVVVDRKGRGAARVIGKTSDSTLSGLVKDALAEP